MRLTQAERGSRRAETPRHSGHSHTLGLLAVASASLLWAISAVVARTLFDDGVPPLELAASRAWIACLGLSMLRPWRSPTRVPLPFAKLFALGASIALVNSAYYLAIQKLDVAVAVVLEFTAPVLVVVWVAFTRRRAPSPLIAGAVVAAVLGVALLSEVFSTELSGLDGVGLAAGITAAFFFASYTLLSELANVSYGALGAMFRAFTITSVVWIGFQAFRGWPAELVDPANVTRVLFVGVLGTIVPFLLYVWGIGHVSSERASIAATLEVALAGIIAWVWLDQRLSASQVAGAALILTAVVALQLKRREKVIAPEP